MTYRARNILHTPLFAEFYLHKEILFESVGNGKMHRDTVTTVVHVATSHSMWHTGKAFYFNEE
jgi:hypothetical protein